MPPVSAPDALDESQEIARAKNGDLEAFDRLVAAHQTKIFNFCLWFLRDYDDASDAAQETFIRAFRHLKSFRGDCALGSWLSRIAANVCRDSAAKRKTAPREFSSLETPEGEFDPVFEGESPTETLVHHERIQAVREALATLPENHRTAIVLFDLQGRSYEECAEILELPMGTVKSRLNRARQALKEALGPVRELFS